MRASFAALALAALTLATARPATAAPVPDFRALYRSVDGTSASTDVSSTYDAGEGTHTLIARRVTDENREYVRTLRFKLDDERVRPVWYREEDRRCASCTVTVTFDWDRRFLQYDTRGEQRFASTAERDGTPSQLARDVAMLVSLLPGRREVAGFDDALVSKALGTIELDTPLGRLHAEGRALRGTWDQTVWLAPEFDLLPVRIHAFGITVALSELSGLARSASAGAVTTRTDAAGDVRPEAAAVPIPEYRAVYRLDSGRRVGVGRYEVAVTHDRGTDVYEFVATAVENKNPEEVLTFKMPFRLRGERVEPLAGMLAFLPGDRAIAGMDDVLTVEPQGRSEVELAMGSFAVERAVLLGTGEDMSAEVWRAGALARLPVRFSGPLMARKATTMELIELEGIGRAAAAD